MIVTRSHKYRHHYCSCCDIETFRHTCRSKTAEVEHRHHRPIKARLFFLSFFLGALVCALFLFFFVFFFETDLNGKVLPLLETIGQRPLSIPTEMSANTLALRSVAFIETALNAILQASFIGILLCRRHFPSHFRDKCYLRLRQLDST